MSHAIEVQDLVFRYHLTEALHGITFHLDQGEVVGLLGPNGAGKGTTLKILTGTLPPTAGLASVHGFRLPD